MALYHSARGSVNYTIVGSPTIVDNVVSGFSSDDYLVTTQQFSSISPEKLELQAKFTPTNLNNTYQYIVSYQTTGGLNGGKSGFRINSNNRLQYKVSYYSDGSGDLLITSSANIQVNSSIIAKGYYIGDGVYGLDVSTDDGNTWLTDTVTIDGSKTIELNSSYGAYIGRTSTAGTDINVFSGSIDLKHTYIIVNGQPWFGICPIEVKKHQVMGPVGYTVVGSPTITDGVLTGVSSGNDCYTSSSLPSFNELEMVFKAKRYTWPSAATILPICAFGSGNSNRRLTPNASSDATGGTRLINGSTIVVNIPNSYFDLQTYGPLGYYTRIKVTKNTSDYTYELGLSADGNTWVTNSANYSTNMCTGAVYFLRNSSGYTGSNGEMDLNETYIKVNGKLWFWQPRETEKIVVNGVQVWQKSS